MSFITIDNNNNNTITLTLSEKAADFFIDVVKQSKCWILSF